MEDTVTFQQAKEILDTEPDSVLLDVREPEEYETGHAKNAVLLPVDSITEQTAEEAIPDMETAVLLYCRSGRRSRIARQKLQRMGYARVYDIGSLVGWPYGLTR